MASTTIRDVTLTLTATERDTLRRATLKQLVDDLRRLANEFEDYVQSNDLDHPVTSEDARNWTRTLQEDLDALGVLGYGESIVRPTA